MKYYNRILLLAMVAGITVSCADALFADYKTEKPESLPDELQRNVVLLSVSSPDKSGR